MEEAVNLSVEQVEAAGQRVEGATVAAEGALVALASSFEEWITLQKALQILTRRTSAPFEPNIPTVHPLHTLIAEWYERLGLGSANKAERTANRPQQLPSALPPPPPRPTKVGIIYDAALAVPLDKFKNKDILKAIPADAPIPISSDDVSRAVPRLMNKGLIWRDRDGYLHRGAPPQNGDRHGFPDLTDEDRERSARLPLAS